MLDMSVRGVAREILVGYTGRMSEPRQLDLISAKDAQKLLHIQSKPTFYEVLARVQAEYGLDMRVKPFAMAKRARYDRSEIEALERGDIASLRDLVARRLDG